jgi:YHS domain-containing protein
VGVGNHPHVFLYIKEVIYVAACKCKKCQANLNTRDAYKTTINNKTAYFCNEEHHLQYLNDLKNEQKQKERNKQLQQRFYNLFCDILGVQGITNTILYKEKKEINKVFKDEIIISYLEENKEWINSTIAKLNGTEYGKIRYVCAILKNKLGDYRPQTIQKEIFSMNIKDEHYETKFKLKPRIGLETLEEECYE